MNCYTEILKAQGLTPTLINNKVNVKPSYLVSEEISAFIKTHKEAIKSELLAANNRSWVKPKLNSKQAYWLARIANQLRVDTDFLLQHQFIDEFDLVEQLHNNPKLIADSILTNPRWYQVEKPRYKVVFE